MFPVEEFRDTLLRVVGVLNRFSVRFHLTGGAATIAYAEPRLTQDIDLVIDRGQLLSSIDDFVQAVEHEGFMFEETTIRSAIADGKGFQLLDIERILKIDLYPRELITGELDRSIQLPVFDGISIPVVALQDLILSKLIWISHGSGKSRADLRWLWRKTSVEEQAEVRLYAKQHQLDDLLEEVLRERDEIDL